MTGYVSAGYVSSGYVSNTNRGLEYGVTAFINVGAKTFRITVDTTVQNWYSFWLDEWIINATLANIAFPIEANGPNSFTLIDGWEFSDGEESIHHFRRDGLRYVNSSGTATASWAAILSSGVPSGFHVRYQQQDGLNTTNALRTGNIDQLIQIYGDATHGNFDYTNYLVLKVQAEGYDQAESNVVSLYGTLEDQLYVVGLTPLANGIATGDPALTIIISQGTYIEDGKTFSIKIVDNATPSSGTDILRELRYNFAAGGTYQGEDAFNWHDLVQVNDSAFKTVRGTVYGSAATKGVLVYQNDGVTLHPAFTLFTADNGTTYAPVIPVTATATILAGSRIQLYNVTQAVEIENITEAATAYSYTITTEANDGDTLRLRVTKLGYEGVEVFGVFDSVSGVTFLVTQSIDQVYSDWGIDGSTVTEYSLDGPNLQIDANDVDGVSTKTRLGAYYNFALTTEIGIRQFFGALTFLSTAAIRVNTSIADLFIENTNATTALRFTDLTVRLYKDNGTSIIAPTSYSIHNDYSGVPDVVETGVSGLTGAESSQLMGLTNAPSAPTVASAVRTELASELSNIDASVSSRLASSSYTAAPATGDIVSAIRSDLSIELNRIDTSISSRLATSTYTPVTTENIAEAVLTTLEENSISVTVDVTAIKNAIWTDSKALTVPKFLGLK